MEYASINVILKDLPCKINGLTSKNEYGEYLIILNARLDDAHQVRAYEHEIKHIREHDYENADNVDAIESTRHNII